MDVIFTENTIAKNSIKLKCPCETLPGSMAYCIFIVYLTNKQVCTKTSCNKKWGEWACGDAYGGTCNKIGHKKSTIDGKGSTEAKHKQVDVHIPA